MNFLEFSINYSSNFSPSLKKKKSNKIITKNILLFLLLLNYKNKKISTNIFVKPIQKKNFLILRAPYRYKLGRLNIGILRYNIHLKIKIFSNTKFKKYIKKKFFLISLAQNLESNLLNLHKTTVKYTIFSKQNFLIKNFF